jgi:hypothetical protein
MKPVEDELAVFANTDRTEVGLITVLLVDGGSTGTSVELHESLID